jgi:hypothetical protein
MAFTVPDFNLTCNIFTGPFATRVLRLASVCNLARGRRVLANAGDYTTLLGQAAGGAYLLLPAGTDVRDVSQGSAYEYPSQDIIEVPAGSGRWYGCIGWEDVGKGYPNEFRIAQLSKLGSYLGGTFAGSDWPIPGP